MKGKHAKTGGREGRMWGWFPSEKGKKIINTPKCTQQITKTQNRTNKSFKSKFKGNQTVWKNKGLTGSQDCRLARWVFSAAPNSFRGSRQASKKWVGLPKFTQSEKEGLQIQDSSYGFPDTLFKIQSREKMKSGTKGRTTEGPKGLQESPRPQSRYNWRLMLGI